MYKYIWLVIMATIFLEGHQGYHSKEAERNWDMKSIYLGDSELFIMHCAIIGEYIISFVSENNFKMIRYMHQLFPRAK